MYPRSFLYKEVKIKERRTFSRKELREIVRKQYGYPDSHAFVLIFRY